LFMTATPRFIGETKRKQVKDSGQEIISMCDKKKFGKEFHKLKFSDAIRDKILTDYQVAVVVVIGDKNRKFVTEGQIVKIDKNVQTDARTLASQIGLAKAIKKYNLQKIITFHSSVAKAKKFGVSSLAGNNKEAFSDLIPQLPKKVIPRKNIWTQAIFGEMAVDRRLDYLSILEKPDRNTICLIANCRCLSEGVDVPALDGIGFMDPKSSYTDIIQAVGRAIRKSDEKKIGTIFIPVFIDEEDDVDAILSSSAFKPVWSVIRALRSHDDDLADKLDDIRISLGQNKKISLPSKIKFDLPTKLSIKSFQKAFYIKTIESTTTNWDAMVKLLKEYKIKYGHFNPPKKMEKRWKDLFEWAHQIRLEHGRNELTRERVEELGEIGFDLKVYGQTLFNTKGLLIEKKFAQKVGIGQVKLQKFRNENLITPVGTGISSVGLSYFYHPSQINELIKKLGITLLNTKGLLYEKQFILKSGVYREKLKKSINDGLVKPLGIGISKTQAGICNFYHPRQIKELRNELGITLSNTKGLIVEKNFASQVKIDMRRLKECRVDGLINPVGTGFSRGNDFSYYYHPSQINELRKKLGITLNNTKGLISEARFLQKSGLVRERLKKCREEGLIKPFGTSIAKGGLSNFYHPRQVDELRKKLGITLANTKGLLVEKNFILRSGINQKKLKKCLEKDLIKPEGTAVSYAGVSNFYHPRQIKELRNKLGITLSNTKGLLAHKKFASLVGIGASTLTNLIRKELINPFGVGGTGEYYFYHPRQVDELRKKLGITLANTKGLLVARQFVLKLGMDKRKFIKLKDEGLIKPVGTAVTHAGISDFYHPRQIAELKKKLKDK
jgi:DNA-binding transcriptional MerR regulator